jgi:hypothetical protein
MTSLEQLIRSGLPDHYLANRWLDLTLLAGLYAALVVLFMRQIRLGSHLRTSRQKMLAAAYAMLLYRRIPQRVIRSEAGLICSNLKYLAYLSPTLVFGGIAFAAALGPLHERYGSEPLRIGESFLVSLEGPGELQFDKEDFAVEARVRVSKLQMTWAKLAARHAGLLPLRLGAHVLAVNVDRPSVPRVAKRVWDDLTVHVTYPPGSYGWAGWFGGISIALAGILMRSMGVQV